jgi:ubiquinone/menaquinone biosynthesis C-methylase UbiE
MDSMGTGTGASRPIAVGVRASLDQLEKAWTTLAEADPLWAVCVSRDRRGGRWDIAEFMASGRAEVGLTMQRLDQLGICQGRDTALDFGCGVGRLTGALTGYFGTVTGVDIAEPMLARARGLHAGQPDCSFVRNDRPDLSVFPDATFDLVYSSIVLQHLPRDLAAAYLRDFVRVVRPGGAIAIVVPVAHQPTPSGLVYSLAPQPVIGLLQRRFFGYQAAMQMHTMPARRVARILAPFDARLIASDPRPGVGPHWRFACHFIACP